ncbi:LysR family transcriptional regulator [Nocardia huaxiensis]|uniref:LysR family transcriptional regulator n=1 Tax=Nocardia huaxiensis TaxID=2755382 RepID=A0A7D6V8Q6_9NOCA|nr:LysR family transcriptional regulator [Nocardia huaxiensis]QLY30341.1 LysR family transcriptional regulator [Nocardia huaxiensis]UFS96023.1 LysR family transcriptional regulator [Nocardia huaxiensis]
MPLSPRVPDLGALDLLLSVIELGSLGRAAQAHGISQPSASSRIRYLEQLVGVPVLERTTLGSRPTAAGALIAEWARDVVEAAARLDAGIDTLRAQRDSRLRVAASQTIAEYLFPKWLMALRARMPDTSIALVSGNSAEVGKAVLEGRAGIGFVESPSVPRDLESHVVARDRLLVVVGPGHRWARRSEISAQELADTALIYREGGSGTRISFEKAMIRGIPGWKPNVLLELSSTTAIKTAVAEGVAPAVLSSLAVASELADGSLISPAVTGLDLDRSLRAVWPKGQRPTGPARDLYTIARRPA